MSYNSTLQLNNENLEEILEIANNLPDAFTLPVASAETLGGVKVGTGRIEADKYNDLLYMQDDVLKVDNLPHNMADMGKNIVNLWPDNITVQVATAFKWGPICCFVYQFDVTTAITAEYGFSIAELPWAPVTRFWLNNSTQFYQDQGHKYIRRNSTTLSTGNYVLSGWYMSNDTTMEV